MIQINQPNNFNALYDCDITISNTHPTEPEHVVTIKLPVNDYNKFLRNWNEYMTILAASRTNPYVGEQLHQLLAFATLCK